MPETNEYGDLVITEPGTLRLLAEPGNLDLFEHLSRRDPATAEELTAVLGVDGVEDRLRRMTDAGLVERQGEDRWATTGRGLYFEIPDDPEGAAAARALSNVMLDRYVDLPRRWIADDEPRLDTDWARASGMLNAGFTATADELRTIQDEFEKVLAPYTNRKPEDAPDGSRRVRVLSYFLPSASI
jgi:DNA-binding transcriptional ArsR family regulator